MIRTARDIAQEYLDKTEKTYKSAKKEYFYTKYWLLGISFVVTFASALNGAAFIIPIIGITVEKGSLQNAITFFATLSVLIQGYIQLKDPHTEWIKKFRSYIGILFEVNRYDVGAPPYQNQQTKDVELTLNTENVIRSSLWSIGDREGGKSASKEAETVDATADSQLLGKIQEVIQTEVVDKIEEAEKTEGKDS